MPSFVDSALLMTTGFSNGLLPLPAKAVAGLVEVSKTSNCSRYWVASTPSGSVGGVTFTRTGVGVLAPAASPRAAMLPLSITGSAGLGLYQRYRRNVEAAAQDTALLLATVTSAGYTSW